MTRNRKIYLAALTVLPGLLFYLAWPPKSLVFLSFIALVPLFLLEKETEGIKRSGWLIYASILFFNILTTWWVGFASAGGAIFMLLANSWLMYLPWWAYRKTKQTLGLQKALILFACLWLGYEHLHLHWQITWPWLVLGNVFAKHNTFVQWYEFTGAMGGSVWVILINILVFIGIIKQKKSSFTYAGLGIIIPIILSLVVLNNRLRNAPKNKSTEVVIVQPNINAYTKFSSGRDVENFEEMLAMAEQQITDSTQYVIMPETAMTEYVDEDHLNRSKSIKIAREFVAKHPQIHLITGVSSYNFYEPNETPSPTARNTERNGQKVYYESYNTAMEVDPEGGLKFHHKMKLVPGVESMPYPKVFGFLEYFSIDMGGISGSLGRDRDPINFEGGESPDVAPLICYESVFPELCAEFTSLGAEILLVITNDGWWKDTDGYKQHKYYASLRAIENRREVLRSANTGISCHINTLGEIITETKWDEAIAINVLAQPNSEITFYTRHGDYIGKIASFIGIFMFLSVLVKRKVSS